MPHALISNLIHAVFSTKDRADTIPDPEALGRYLGGVDKAKHIPLIIANGTLNHVHVLIALPATMPLAKVIQDLKGNSSRWLHQTNSAFAWQQGYSAFSVSPQNKRTVIGYIRQQKCHHAKQSFDDELLTMLHKAEIDYDERFIFG
jgi:REP element-mobilizing transposase RayT